MSSYNSIQSIGLLADSLTFQFLLSIMLSSFIVSKLYSVLTGIGDDSPKSATWAPTVEEVGTWQQMDGSGITVFTPTGKGNPAPGPESAQKGLEGDAANLARASMLVGVDDINLRRPSPAAAPTATVTAAPAASPRLPGLSMETPPRRPSGMALERKARNVSEAFNWILFSPQKAKPHTSTGAPFRDYGDNLSEFPSLQSRDPYLSSRLMRKCLLSLVPIMRQAALHEALAKMYLVAQDRDCKAASSSSAMSPREEINVRAGKTRLMMASLFAAFDDEFRRGMPLPRSATTAAIGIEQALKDACRERIVLNGVEMKYLNSASEAPEVAATELTERLGDAVSNCRGVNARDKETLGRLVGRILGALCRTGTGGDTYCAVNALFDIAGTIQNRGGISDQSFEDAAVYPFLIMPANVLGEGGLEDEFEESDGTTSKVVSLSAVEVPGPLHLNLHGEGEGPVAEVVTTSLLDVHLADEVMQPSSSSSSSSSSSYSYSARPNLGRGRAKAKARWKAKERRNSVKGDGGDCSGGGLSKRSGIVKPIVRLRATIVEAIGLDVNNGHRDRSLRLEVV